jgi:antitoxin YefM
VSRAQPGPTAYTEWYTSGVAKTVPVRELRESLARLLDQVADLREHVVVTRHGRPAAVLIPIDEYESLEETAELLSDPRALESIATGLAEIERGETVTLDELREELAERRSER